MRRILVLMLVMACTSSTVMTTIPVPPTPATVTVSTTAEVSTTPTTTIAPITTLPPEPGTVRPDWLGTRILPERPDGLGEVQTTPLEMVNRRFPTIDLLGPAASSDFIGTVGPVPPDVLARSTWREGCPVAVEELSYLVVTFMGFDSAAHIGEAIVNVRYGEQMLDVFETVYAQGFPLEQMRVITYPELDAPPTGDWNDTTSFVCRPVVAQDSGWPMHAYGLAIDLNPFHNPYWRGKVVVPELAGAYTDRTDLRPGMLHPDDPGSAAIIDAFAAIGWEWGGNWQTLKDWMHFSENGR
ncbi:M15 family metallopeptidase [soil metagenome]